MNDKTQQTKKEKIPEGYYLGEVAQETENGKLLVEVIVKPDGTPMSMNHVLIEILNNQLAILKFLKLRL